MEANNTWMGIGNLGADPVLRKTASGDSVCNFRIAIDRAFKQGGRTVTRTTWIPVVAWREDAEHYAKWLQKGSLVAVTGRLDVREWDDKDGKTHTSFEITASDVKFLANVRSKADVVASNAADQLEVEM